MAKKQIPFLPNGWIWFYKGEKLWSYTDKQGVVHVSDERHAENLLTGEVMSTGRALAEKRRQARQQGITPVQPQQRQGVTRRRYAHSQLHGEYVVIYARDLEALRELAITRYDPQPHPFKKYERALIQLRFAKSKIPGKNYLQWQSGRGGQKGKWVAGHYATLSRRFIYIDDLLEEEWPWTDAYAKAEEFTLDSNSRFELWLSER